MNGKVISRLLLGFLGAALLASAAFAASDKVLIAGGEAFGSGGDEVVGTFLDALSPDLGDDLLLVVPSARRSDGDIVTLAALLTAHGADPAIVDAENLRASDLNGKAAVWIAGGEEALLADLFDTLSGDLADLGRSVLLAATGEAASFLGGLRVEPVAGNAPLLHPEELVFSAGADLLPSDYLGGALVVPEARAKGYGGLLMAASASANRMALGPDGEGALFIEGDSIRALGNGGTYIVDARASDPLAAGPLDRSDMVLSYMSFGDSLDGKTGRFTAPEDKDDVIAVSYYWVSEQRPGNALFDGDELYRTVTEDLVDNDADGAYGFSLSEITEEGAEGVFAFFSEEENTEGYWIRDRARGFDIYSFFNVAADVAPVTLTFKDVDLGLAADGGSSSSGGCSLGTPLSAALLLLPLALTALRRR